MSATGQQQPRGQILVLVAIMLIGMLAMLALVLDGGNAYLQRRQAQNAADAAALAGARTYCLTQDRAQAEAVARTYAITNNGATAASVTFPSTNTVNVVAEITFDTYFAHLIGRDQIVASAEAASGCFAGVSAHVLPIAWACHRPAITSTVSLDCIADVITFDQARLQALNPRAPTLAEPYPIYPELYIIMDSSSLPNDVDDICMTTTISGTVSGHLNCDVDGDGDSDLIANGDRSWLDLDGLGGGASDLSAWVDGSQQVSIDNHTWLGGQTGAIASVYQTVGNFAGSVFSVPVFDDICDQEPAQTGACDNTQNFYTGIIEDRVHTEDTIIHTNGTGYYYHVIGFASFYVTCVQETPGRSTRVTASGIATLNSDCPGYAAARHIGSISNSTKTIEGYFVSGIMPDMVVDPSQPGLDMGTYGLVLLK